MILPSTIIDKAVTALPDNHCAEAFLVLRNI
jgi:hypothetical protein